jgi:undecaprenyl-diphosphatase
MVSVGRQTLGPLQHFVRRTMIGLVVVVAATTGSAALLVLAQLGWPPLEQVDRNVATALGDTFAGQPTAITGLTAVTALGGNPVMWWLVTVTAVGMLLRRQAQLAAYLVVTGLGALALSPIVALLVQRLREHFPAPDAATSGSNFVSGHALNATVFYGALLLVFLPAIPRRLRGLTLGLVAALVAAIGFTRAALGVHHASEVVAGWLLGVAWLAVTAQAFRRWRVEIGQSHQPLSDGLQPDAAGVLAPTRVVPMPHPWRAVTWLVTAWVLVAGVLIASGTLVIRLAPGFDEAVPRWLAGQRSPDLNAVSQVLSQAGNTHAILAIGLVIGPLAIGCIHRWRPAVFLAVTMFGELALFLAVAAAVGRDRPYVTQLDGHLATSAFPSGHTAATACLYGALAVIVVPRVRGWPRRLAIAIAVLMPALVGLSRIYRGESHPLDVTGGIVLALLWLTAVTIALQPNADLQDAAPPPSDAAVGDAADVTAGTDRTVRFALAPAADRPGGNRLA